MPTEYPYEIRIDARDYFVIEGQTYDQVAIATGVSVAQLKRWGKDENWKEERKEYREEVSSIRRDKIKLRATLLKSALSSGGDPQKVYAYAAIEKALGTGPKDSTPSPVPPTEHLKNINSPADAVKALQEVVELRINKLLHQPELLEMKHTKDLKQTMELIDQMKAKYAPDAADEEKTEGGLSDEAAEMIRQQILGVNQK